MTVSSTTATQTFACDGVTTAFTCPFRVLSTTEMRVYLITIATGASVLLTNGVDYNVSNAGTAANATVTTTATYSNAYRLKCKRRTNRLQETDYRDNDPFPAESHETLADRQIMIGQELDEDLSRAILAPDGETLSPLPSATDRALKIVGFDSSGGLVVVVPSSGSAAALALLLASTANTTEGDAMVGVKRTEAGASARTLHFYIQHSKLHVSNYCDPTSDTAAQVATALATAITDAKGGGKALEFETGATYTTNAETAFLGAANLRGLRFWGNGCTIYRNTGAGPVVSLDSSGDALRCDDIEFLDFVLKGQAAATYGLDMRGVLRSRIRARAADVATAGFRTKWSVLTDHDFTVSDNIDTFTVNPATGLIVTQSSAGNYSACNKYHVIMEGPITSLGVDYEYGGLGNIFTGSCENIPRGFRQRSTAFDAILLGMDFEGNSVYDLLIEGRGLKFVDSEASSAGSSPTIALAATASDTTFRGGFARQIDIDTAAAGTTINDLSVSDNPALGITGTGAANWKGSGNVKVDTNRAITSAIADQLGAIGSFTATLTGCTTSPTGSISYVVNGSIVTLTIPAITATSNTTAATLTGMPAAIRPAANRIDVGVTTDNGVSAVSQILIDSAGVITLGFGAGATFTAAGTKGVQLCTITYKL